ncbi:MAG TPA: tetratricopeptide repeat protein [bacterium]
METRSRKNLIIILMVVLVVITFLTFLPSLNNGYTNWDDSTLILENSDIQTLSWSNIATILSSSYVGTYIPLTMLSFALEYRCSGQMFNPRVSHTTNLVLHLFNTLLVFYLFYLLSQNLTTAFIVSILFALHPLHVESVAWATERKDMLYSMFFLSALIIYIIFLNRRKLTYYLLTIFLFVLSIFAKPMAMTLPLVLVLFDYLHQRRLTIKILLEKIPLFCISILFLVINILAQQTLHSAQLKVPANIFVACRNIIFYLSKLFAPFNLSAFYPYPNNINRILSLPLDYLLAPLAVIGFGVILWLLYVRKTTKRAVFASLFFIITVFPVIQLVPLVGFAIAAERYMYAPSLGVLFLLVLGFLWLYNYLKRNYRLFWLNAVSFILAGVIVALAVLSFNRCYAWKDSITLWNNVLTQFPDNPVALNNRGLAYFQIADSTVPGLDRTDYYSKALADFNRAIAIEPNIAYFHEQRGFLYQKTHKFDEALADYNRALELDPTYAQVYNDRGIIYFNSGDLGKALADYNQALKINPKLPMAYMNRGDLRFVQKRYFDAIDDYSRSIKLNDRYSDAYYNRGVAYGRTGQYDRAIADYDRALILDPKKAAAYHNRGNIYLNAAEFGLALADYNKALELDTMYTTAYYYRGMAEYQLGMSEKALEDVLKARSLGFPVPPEVVEEIKKRK